MTGKKPPHNSEKNTKEHEDREHYKENQAKRLAAFAIGKKDINGSEILSVLVRADDWIIYEIKTPYIAESLKVYIDTSEEDDPTHVIPNFDKIRPSFIKFKNMLYKVNDYAAYRASAAQIISHGLSGQCDTANKQFEELIDEISANYLRQFHDRLNYMVAALIFVIINVLLSFTAYVTRYFADMKQVETLIYVGTGASLGGFISISRKLTQMVFERGLNSRWFIIYAIERIFISIFAGIVVYYAIKSNLVFGQVTKLKQPIYGYVLFAIVAGFSETLVPNLLIKFEGKQK